MNQKTLKRYLLYYPETGLFIRKINSGPAKEGDVAGTISKTGYVYISIEGKRYRAHRLAFLYMKGSIPKYVDHINGDRKDNRWDNLRPATKAQNAYNQKTNSNNKSGVKGVWWYKATRKWFAQLSIEGKKISLGYFKEIEDAKKAMKEARTNLHKEYANHGEIENEG